MIIMYATDKCGDGMVVEIGQYESWEDIIIRCSMFTPEVVITFEERKEDTKD